MHCPNCHHILIQKTLDKIVVDHCEYCGGTLFDANEINRITLQDAKNLNQDKFSDVISAEEKFSPKDGSRFERMDDQSIPPDVTLLKSKSTGEVFAFPDDLIHFKEAQEAKVSYFKAWNIPLPSLASVLVLGLLIVTSVSLVFTSSLLMKSTSYTTQASSLCERKLHVIKSADKTIVSCQTTTPLICNAFFTCGSDEKVVPLSKAPATIHIASVSKECSKVKIVCSDNNQTVESEWFDL